MNPKSIVLLGLFRRRPTSKLMTFWGALLVSAMIGAASVMGETSDTAALSNTGVTVPSTANSPGAGHSSAPNEGNVPPAISFPAVAGQTVTFPNVTGTV